MANHLPALVLTGASGIVGRSFLESARDRYRIFAIARRAQHRVGVENHPNIEWIQVDIENRAALARITDQIQRRGGADFLVHLAAYYDFENLDRHEFRTTNVDGTRNILAQAEALSVKRFVFASSVAACSFPEPGAALTEDSAPDAEFPYARSKRIGEDMVREASQRFPCSIVRLAAVFDDWCEYAPLYVFLETWLSESWNSRILGGRGLTAIPYIHTRDLNRLFLTVLDQTARLPRFGLYQASPDGATTHAELFELATRFHFGHAATPILMPKALAWAGLLARDWWTRILGRRAFERIWMLEYLDRRLAIDASRTRRQLGWAPHPRFHILRRLLFLIAKMKSEPQEWFARNERALRRPPERPALVIHDAMVEAREAIIDAIVAYLQSPVRHERFPHHAAMPYADLQWHTGIVYDLLSAAVRTADRGLLLTYVYTLTRKRLASGFPPSEIGDALLAISEITVEQLLYKPELASFSRNVRDSITLSIALAIDGIQDAYEAVTGADVPPAAETGRERDLEAIVTELLGFYRNAPERPCPGPDARNRGAR